MMVACPEGEHTEVDNVVIDAAMPVPAGMPILFLDMESQAHSTFQPECVKFYHVLLSATILKSMA